MTASEARLPTRPVRRLRPVDRPRPSARSRVLPPLLLGLVLVLLAGCRVAPTVTVEVRDDGTAEAEVAIDLDVEVVAMLEELDLDPAAELAVAAASTPAWDFRREPGGTGGVRIVLSRATTQVATLTADLRSLSVGLAEGDPALVIDLDVTVDAEGAATLTGTAGIRPPTTIGALQDGDPIGPAGDELAALLATGVDAWLVVTLPGEVAANDADRLDELTFAWQLPVGELRAVNAQTTPAEPAPLWPVALAVVAGLVLGWLLMVAVRARRRRRRGLGSLSGFGHGR